MIIKLPIDLMERKLAGRKSHFRFVPRSKKHVLKSIEFKKKELARNSTWREIGVQNSSN